MSILYSLFVYKVLSTVMLDLSGKTALVLGGFSRLRETMINTFEVEVESIRVGYNYETAKRKEAAGTFQRKYGKLKTPFGELDSTSLID